MHVPMVMQMMVQMVIAPMQMLSMVPLASVLVVRTMAMDRMMAMVVSVSPWHTSP